MNEYIAEIKDGAIAAQKQYGVPASLLFCLKADD